MNFISVSTIFYIIDNLIVPLASTILMLLFLLFFINLIKKDQLDIFNNAQFMEPKKARSYLEQVRKEKIEKEFEILLGYEKLFETHRKDYLKLRNEGLGVKDIIFKINPPEKEK